MSLLAVVIINALVAHLAQPRTLLFSRQDATLNELEYVLNAIGEEYDKMHIGKRGEWTVYGQPDWISSQIEEKGVGKCLCDAYDVILVSDTLPDARFLYRSDGGAACAAKVILQATNRFDFGVQDACIFYDQFKHALQSPKVFLVPNNDYEGIYMTRFRALSDAETARTTVIRPTGGYTQQTAKLLANGDKTAIINDQDYSKNSLALLRYFGAQMDRIVPLESPYGGPLTLSQYKYLIYVPDQFSTMKLYENLKHGVLMLVPDPALFKAMVLKTSINEETVAQAKWLFNAYPSAWSFYYDVYAIQKHKVVYYFSTWLEAINIISGKMTLNRTFYAQNIDAFLAKHDESVIAQWRDLFKRVREDGDGDGTYPARAPPNAYKQCESVLYETITHDFNGGAYEFVFRDFFVKQPDVDFQVRYDDFMCRAKTDLGLQIGFLLAVPVLILLLYILKHFLRCMLYRNSRKKAQNLTENTHVFSEVEIHSIDAADTQE